MSSNVGKKCFKLWCVLCTVYTLCTHCVHCWTFNDVFLLSYYYYYYYYYWYSALGLVWAGTGTQSGDRYGSGTLHPGQVLRGSLPLLSPGFLLSISTKL
jgi:hypothetical protein